MDLAREMCPSLNERTDLMLAMLCRHVRVDLMGVLCLFAKDMNVSLQLKGGSI